MGVDVVRLDPAGVHAVHGSQGAVYGERVARRRWYRTNLSGDIQRVAQRLETVDRGVVVDVSAGTGIASELLLVELRQRRQRIHKLVLADVDYTLTRSYMDFAMAAIAGRYDDVVDCTEFYLLPASSQGFATIADIPGLTQAVDCILFENAIHVVPENQKRRTLQGIADCMHHEALLVMGSGGIIGTGSSETTAVDSLFHEVRRRVLELCRTCDRYAPLAAVVVGATAADIKRQQLLRERVFPPNPTLDSVMSHLRSVGLDPRAHTSETVLDREDYRPFVIEIETLVDAAILPECSAGVMRRRNMNKETACDEDELSIIRKEILSHAYDEVWNDHSEHLTLLWTSFVASTSESVPRRDKDEIGPRPDAVTGSLY